MPEIHISIFEPQTLALALADAGFNVTFPGFGPGWADIIRFKLPQERGSSVFVTR